MVLDFNCIFFTIQLLISSLCFTFSYITILMNTYQVEERLIPNYLEEPQTYQFGSTYRIFAKPPSSYYLGRYDARKHFPLDQEVHRSIYCRPAQWLTTTLPNPL